MNMQRLGGRFAAQAGRPCDRRGLLSTMYRFDAVDVQQFGGVAGIDTNAGGTAVVVTKDDRVVVVDPSNPTGGTVLDLMTYPDRAWIADDGTVLVRGLYEYDNKWGADLGIYQDNVLKRAIVQDGLAPDATVAAVGFASQSVYRFTMEFADDGGLSAQTLANCVTAQSNLRGALPLVPTATAADGATPARTVRQTYSVSPAGTSRETITISLGESALSDMVGNRTTGRPLLEVTFSGTSTATTPVFTEPGGPAPATHPEVLVVPLKMEYDSFPNAALSPDGRLVAISGSDPNGQRIRYMYPVEGGGSGYTVPEVAGTTDSRIQLLSDTSAVVLTTDGVVYRYSPGVGAGTPLNNPADLRVSDFDVTADGSALVVGGSVSAGGALAASLRPGAGLFASVTVGGRPGTFFRVVGGVGNGLLEPGETWADFNLDMQFTPVSSSAEDVGAWAGSGVGIAPRGSGEYEVTFRGAEPTEFDANVIYNVEAVRLKADPASPSGFAVSNYEPMFFVPDTHLPFKLGAITANGIYRGGIDMAPRPLKDGGQVLFLLTDRGAGTAKGRTFLVRATEVGRRPVLFFHGVAASLPNINQYDAWVMQRGWNPEQLFEDPVAHAYDNLIQSFANAGYARNRDLYVANYDWRLPWSPGDGGIDGVVGGVTAASITAGTYNYAVDYVGYWLKRAADDWRARYGVDLDRVDMVAHSMGGLVARSYVQSTAYGGSDVAGHPLPRVAELITLASPHRGASKAWNFTNDDWGVESTYYGWMAKIAALAYRRVLAGEAVTNAPGTPPITRNDILTGGAPDPKKFIALYVPSAGELVPTYPFLVDDAAGSNLRTVNSDPGANRLLLDLNNGFDSLETQEVWFLRTASRGRNPNLFAASARSTVFFATGNDTYTYAQGRVGPSSPGGGDVFPMDAPFALPAAAGQVWYDDLLAITSPPSPMPPTRPSTVGGDTTVPVESARGQFVGDPAVYLRGFVNNGGLGDAGILLGTTGSTTHTGMPGNVDVQLATLQRLGLAVEAGRIADESHFLNIPWGRKPGAAYDTYVSIDRWPTLPSFSPRGPAGSPAPLKAYLTDALGRRLGMLPDGSVVSEIPDGSRVGQTAAWLMAFGELVGPLTLTVAGDGQPFAIRFGRTAGDAVASVEITDTLPAGVTRVYDLPEPVAAGGGPEVRVMGGTAIVPSGSTQSFAANSTDFGVVPVGQPATRAFTIGNTGNRPAEPDRLPASDHHRGRRG